MVATLEASPSKKMGRPKLDEKEVAERHRAAMRERRKAIREIASDIGPIPPVVDPERRKACERDFLKYLQTYEQAKFPLPFSESHLRLIRLIEQAVLESGLFANALPRGSGKTTICRAAVRWALLYGHHRYVMLIGAEDGHADSSKNAIVNEFENNDLLMEDFPEVCVPFAALDGATAKCKSQRSNGERTLIEIDNVKKKIILPWIEGSPSKGSVLRWTGITGRIRGENHAMPDGVEMRPSLAIIDDPQTDESAKSEPQNASRLEILRQAIIGLAGPGKKMAAIVPCTIIKPGDMADQLLDLERCPEWNGEKVGFFLKYPDNLDLWDAYMELVQSKLREAKIAGGNSASAYEAGKAFVEANFLKLHEGAQVYWPERFDPHELSAVHHAFNTILRIKWAGWHAEYQNAPVDPTAIERQIRIEDFEDKPAGYEKGTAPDYCNVVTTFVDVQSEVLFWMTCGFSRDFRAAIIDYGCWPDQGTLSIDLGNLRYPLSAALSKDRLGEAFDAEDARILAALKATIPSLADETIEREDGVKLPVDLVLADRGFMTDTVDKALKELRLPNVLAAKGLPVRSGEKSLQERGRAPGDMLGENWKLTRSTKNDSVRYVQVDTNYWKSFVRDRVLTPAGAAGDVRVYGRRAREHDPLIDHFTCEYGVRVTKKGDTRDEWEVRPGRSRNDWFDCFVGCCVAASYKGCKYVDRKPAKTQKVASKALSFSELQKQRMGK